MSGAFAVEVLPNTTAMVGLPPPNGTGVVQFGQVFLSLASDFDGATVRLAIGNPNSWRIFDDLNVPAGRQDVYELENTDQVASIINNGPQPVSVLIEYQ